MHAWFSYHLRDPGPRISASVGGLPRRMEHDLSTETGVIEISQAQAVRMQLAAQGLLARPRRRATRAGLLQAVERMRLLQIDTIHVVARSPYLVLFSRLGDYPQAWLDEALAEAALAESWAHEACFVPAPDYPLHAGFRPRRAGHWAHKRAQRMLREHHEGMHAVLERVREYGALRSADFTQNASQPRSGWWNWKPEKRFLEAWFALGELMVARRDAFQRVYDLTERVWPQARSWPDAEAVRERFILDAVQALGISQARWIADYHRMPKVADAELQPLLARGVLLPVRVRGWTHTAYVHHAHAPLLAQARAGRLRATHATLLSPFDPLVWDRERARRMFGFDYALECYIPAPKRRYGYFCLPILCRGALVGRVDAKAHRDAGIFELKQLYLEPGVRMSERLLADLAALLHRAAQWHGTPRVLLERCEPVSWRTPLQRALETLGRGDMPSPS